MPRPDPISPADLRPGQRVRITRRRRSATLITDGTVKCSDAQGVTLEWLGTFPADPGPDYTQTIEVIG